MGRAADAAGPRETKIEPEVRLLGSGRLKLSHVAVFRDIHYTTTNGIGPGRALEGNPFTLAADEFFVLGDNSPNSADSRWWDMMGAGNNQRKFPKGVVPREYLVGKALFVYWPAGFKPTENFPISIVPNIGDMRFIYGGGGQETIED